jgi:hypothetical protein|nr:MAG TPA: hypothetical protein [Caudoviricetes sp.]
MTNISELANELKDATRWQKTPLPLSNNDYVSIIIRALKRLYIDTGRASVFNMDMITKNDDENVCFTEDLPIDEEEYVLLCAQIGFFNQVKTDVNNIVGYTTDALSVTNADKPYANIKDSIEKLENERRITYYKMIRYVMS